MASRFRRLFVIALLAFAPAASAAPCASGTLAEYISIGSCEIGTTVFSGFTTIIPVGDTPLASQITLTPIFDVNPGFTFGVNAVAAAGERLSAVIAFQAFADTSLPFGGLTADLAGATVTGDGLVAMIEDVCVGGLFAIGPFGCVGSPVTLMTRVDALLSQTSDSTTFTEDLVFDFFIEIIVDGGAGSAALESATVRLLSGRPIPEPSSLALLCIAAAALLRRRGAAADLQK
jgi:hypothetical protein